VEGHPIAGHLHRGQRGAAAYGLEAAEQVQGTVSLQRGQGGLQGVTRGRLGGSSGSFTTRCDAG
jgi:hypothetical protein